MRLETAAVRAEAQRLGFLACCVAQLGPSERGAEFDAWLARGYAGTMRYLHRQARRRKQPGLIVPKAKVAVVVLENYWAEGGRGGEAEGGVRIASYARGEDYHRALMRRLAQLAGFLMHRGAKVAHPWADSGAVPERELAQRAGLGWVGKNTMLIRPGVGTFFLIGTVFTDRFLIGTKHTQKPRRGGFCSVSRGFRRNLGHPVHGAAHGNRRTGHAEHSSQPKDPGRTLPFDGGMVKVSSEGFPDAEAQEFKTLPFDSTFGLFYAAISYFGFHCLEVRIASDSPSKAALGGSSTALVALIKALSKLAVLAGKPPMPQKDILHLAYHLEDSTSSGKCGIQDQAAAVFGGVNLWRRQFGDRRVPYERTPLLDRKGQRDLSEHLLVAFSGKSHVSARINQGWIEGFLSGKTRAGWIEANRIVRPLAQALVDRKWDRALSPEEVVAYLRHAGRQARYVPSVPEIVEVVVREARAGDVVVIMSNGGFDRIHDKLLDALND